MNPTVQSDPGAISAPPPAAFGPGWQAAAVVAVAIAAAYAPVLVTLVQHWFNDMGEMGHAPLVPFAAGYMIWSRKDELARTPIEGHWPGVVLLVWGALQAVFSTVADIRFLANTALAMSVVGAIWVVWGTRRMRLMVYPLALLLLAIPPPSFAYPRVILELQLIASKLAEHGLELLGFSVLREGNILELPGEKLSVAEACSGVRSLITLTFFFSVYCYFLVEKNWMRVALLLSIFPIAIFCNSLRIIATGVIASYNPALAHGDLHENLGYVVLLLAALLCGGFHRLLMMLPSRPQVANHA